MFPLAATENRCISASFGVARCLTAVWLRRRLTRQRPVPESNRITRLCRPLCSRPAHWPSQSEHSPVIEERTECAVPSHLFCVSSDTHRRGPQPRSNASESESQGSGGVVRAPAHPETVALTGGVAGFGLDHQSGVGLGPVRLVSVTSRLRVRRPERVRGAAGDPLPNRVARPVVADAVRPGAVAHLVCGAEVRRPVRGCGSPSKRWLVLSVAGWSVKAW